MARLSGQTERLGSRRETRFSVNHPRSQQLRAVIGCLSENECTSSETTKLVHHLVDEIIIVKL